MGTTDVHRPKLRKLITFSLAAMVVLVTATATTAAADEGTGAGSSARRTASTTTTASTAGSQPTAAARKAGITRPGQGYMGWSRRAAAPSRTAPPASAVEKPASPSLVAEQTHGIDVSAWQGEVDWQGWWNGGTRFAYVKASESTSYQSESFGSQYNGSYNIGMLRGAYHFATPDTSWGDTQANYFVDSGGGWSADGRTLPGALDIEYNPYGATCYGLSQGDMVNWIAAFNNQYRARTGRDAVIYTTADWWSQCTGDSGAFNTTNPLWVACYCGSVGTIPGGWPYQTIWQNTSTPLDQNWFNGDLNQVQAMANG